ncbi:MAG TPA: hypothetical protein VE093_28415 [Polyangiaceae bacterium]|jgi:hypothetical protein|nr:hypothetical protein [Polyangiaceae bacterium]
MSARSREELLRKAEEVRSHMLDTLEEFERKSHERVVQPGEHGTGSHVQTPEAATSPERMRLEREADHVRDHMIDSIEQLEIKAREKIVPIAVASVAAMFLLTVGFGVLLYRALRS